MTPQKWTWTHQGETVATADPPKDFDQEEIETLTEFYLEEQEQESSVEAAPTLVDPARERSGSVEGSV